MIFFPLVIPMRRKETCVKLSTTKLLITHAAMVHMGGPFMYDHQQEHIIWILEPSKKIFLMLSRNKNYLINTNMLVIFLHFSPFVVDLVRLPSSNNSTGVLDECLPPLRR